MTEHDDLKARIRAAWALGDYAPIAQMLRPAAQDLLDACAISAGQEILDVAAGTGNLALLAAEEGAFVVASDLTPEMVEKGRARTQAADVDVEWRVADAEALPFDDASFDCVTSVFGAIFAPRPEVVAGELFRVVRPGGTVGLTAWGDYGPQAEFFAVMDRFRPQPDGPPKSSLWGDEAVVEERLGPHAARVMTERVTLPWAYDTFDDMWQAFANNGPLVALRQAIGDEQFATMRDEMRQVVARHTGADGRVYADAEYLRIVARKRG